jgi:hypothetical protein
MELRLLCHYPFLRAFFAPAELHEQKFVLGHKALQTTATAGSSGA